MRTKVLTSGPSSPAVRWGVGAAAAAVVTGVLAAVLGGPAGGLAQPTVAVRNAGNSAQTAQTAQCTTTTSPAKSTVSWTIDVCVSDHGTGMTAYPSINVKSVNGAKSPCTIDIETWDDHNHKLGDTPTPCTKGPHDGKAVRASGALGTKVRAHTFARIRTGGTTYPTGDSPTVDLTVSSLPNNKICARGVVDNGSRTVTFRAGQTVDFEVTAAAAFTRVTVRDSWGNGGSYIATPDQLSKTFRLGAIGKEPIVYNVTISVTNPPAVSGVAVGYQARSYQCA